MQAVMAVRTIPGHSSQWMAQVGKHLSWKAMAIGPRRLDYNLSWMKDISRSPRQPQ